jgi:4-amino-4-deoxy-L-arabinose transferase-like glycosyltransferase
MDQRSLPQEAVQERDTLEAVLSVFLVVMVFGLLYFYNLDGWLVNDDEGSFLYQAWRISEGDTPYSDFFTTRWPLFLYTAGGWMRLMGPSIVAMRSLAACLILTSAVIVFLIGRQIQPPRVALLATVLFLIHPEVVRYGRSFQPEPFYLVLALLGLYLFVISQKNGSARLLVAAGIVFGVATLFKLLAVLVLGGCIVYLAISGFQKGKSPRRKAFEGLSLLGPFAAVFGLTAGFFVFRISAFFDCVIGVNLAQGQDLTEMQVLIKGITFLIQYLLIYPVVLLALPAAWRGFRDRSGLGILSWQLPMVLALFVLSRDLFPRLLLFLVPSTVTLVAASLEAIRHLKQQSLLLISLICFVTVPWLVDDFGLVSRREESTLAIVGLIEALVPPDEPVVSDYQELNFYAARRSTYLGAEISHVVVAGNSITSDSLVHEIKSDNVKMVILDVSSIPGPHLGSLQDYASFRIFLQKHFALVDTIPRESQLLEIYSR